MLVTGPSGTGKSSLIPEILERFDRPQCVASMPPADDRPILDTLNLSPSEAAALLCRVGLGDAHHWARTRDELSVGQQHRYDLARLIQTSPGIIVLDDWTAPLDRLTAQAFAWTAGRLLRSRGRSAIICTTHEDIADHLQPDLHIRLHQTSPPELQWAENDPPTAPMLNHFTVRRGTLADYKPLAHLHYAAGPPQHPRAVFAVEHRTEPGIMAVAVLTYPDLSNPARDLVTNGRYRRTSDRSIARLLNTEVARLARVVVDPRVRSIGLTRLLIDHLLWSCELCYLECSTAMAHYTDFLDKLGFIEAPRPPHDIEAALLDWADRHQISPSVAFDPTELQAELDRLSVREARLGRRLIWHYYHRHVLYRRTKQPKPKQVPNANDDRWIPALEFAARRLFERPRYLILPIQPPEKDQGPCLQPSKTPATASTHA